MDSKTLALDQIEKALAEPRPVPPSRGWLKTVREALGMTTRQLAKRLGISQSNVIALEKREALGTASLAQIRRAAHAMNCDVVHVLVPRKPLGQMIESRAREIAARNISGVTHTMRLEAQEPASDFVNRQIETQAAELLAGSWSKLWR